MKYAQIKNYVSEHAAQIKTATLATIVAAALAVGSAGCTRNSGGSLILGSLEWGDRTYIGKEQEIEKKVLDGSPKYEETSKKVPSGYGFSK